VRHTIVGESLSEYHPSIDWKELFTQSWRKLEAFSKEPF